MHLWFMPMHLSPMLVYAFLRDHAVITMHLFYAVLWASRCSHRPLSSPMPYCALMHRDASRCAAMHADASPVITDGATSPRSLCAHRHLDHHRSSPMCWSLADHRIHLMHRDV
jgi:hypothetical protein